MGRLYQNLAKKAMVAVIIPLLSFVLVLPVKALVPNDPNYLVQSKMYQQINAEAAWDITTGSKKVVVAFIDTGLDIWHEDIRDNVWINPHEIPGNNKDDDLNGYIDDLNGWNFVENNNIVRPAVFDIEDDKEAVRHGTLVGGLIGAKGNNGLWGIGMAPNVSLMTLRAIRSDGSGSIKAVIEAINYAVENGASVISLSFMGEKFEQRVYDSLRNAYKNGVTIISAAGNYDSETENGDTSSRVVYPGCFDTEDATGENWILTVGSVDSKDQLSVFSEYGKCLDVLAPGEYVYSTERYAPQYGYDNQFGGPWFGTSFSTPLVAGVAALIKTIHPEYSPKEVIQTIISAADEIDSLNSAHAHQLGYGRVNAGRALANAAATPLKRGQGSLWFFNNNKLWRFDTGTSSARLVAALPAGKIIGFTSYSTFLNDEAAVVTRRNGTYYLEVYNNNGDVRRSMEIPDNSIIGESVIIRFNGLNYFLVSSRLNTKTKKTEFRIYSTESKKLTTLSVKEKVGLVDIDGAGNIYYTTLNRGVLSVRNLKANKTIYTLKDVAKIFDLKVVGGQAVLLASKGSRSIIVAIPVTSGEVKIKIFNNYANKNWKLKVFSYADRLFYLPFDTAKNNYVLYDSNLSEAQTLSLPNLFGEVR